MAADTRDVVAAQARVLVAAQARVLVVGTELLGRKGDLNGPVLARALESRGVRVRGIDLVPDDLPRLARRIEQAMDDVSPGDGGARPAGVVVLAGGLGPTADDVTREALAAATGLAIVEDAPARARIAAFYESRNRQPNELTWRQALVPAGSTVIQNVTGFAAGSVVTHQGAVLALLPGPPGELTAMLDATLDAVDAQLRAAGATPAARPHVRELLLCGIGESDAATRLAALPEVQGLDLAWLPRPGEVRLVLSGERERVESAVAAVRPILGENVATDDGRGLPELLVDVLAQRGETVGAAESCTGGLVNAALTSVSGSSAVLRAGVVAYANEAKTEHLGVDPALIAAHGAVSEEVALAMAFGIRKAASADWGLAVTGVAGPTGGTERAPVGCVWIAVMAPDGQRQSKKLQLHGSRDDVRRASVTAVLDLLRRRLP